MKGRQLAVMVLAAVATLTVTGCATTPQQNGSDAGVSDTDRTRAEGTALGAVVGGLLGALVGDDERSALIGAAVGAGAGYVVGNEIAKRKRQYASEEDFLDAEIQRAAEFNRVARRYNAQLRDAVADLDRQSQRLKSRYEAGEATRSQLVRTRDRVQERLEKSERVYADLEKEYEVKRAVYKEQRARRPADDSTMRKLEQEIQALKENLDTLNTQSRQLAEIDERLTV